MSWLLELIWPFHLLRPWWLLAIPVMAAVWWLVRTRVRPSQGWESRIAPHLLNALIVDRSGSGPVRPVDAVAVALVCAAAAAAGPTWQRLPNPFFAEESPLVIALEVSETMLANDVQPPLLVMP